MLHLLTDYNRLRWHCHRGMLELDLILIPFFDQYYQTLNTSMQEAFVKLLDHNDQELYYWLVKDEEPAKTSLKEIIHLILKTRGSMNTFL